MRREERVTVQGPVKEQQPDGMSHRERGVPPTAPPPPPPLDPPPFLETSACGPRVQLPGSEMVPLYAKHFTFNHTSVESYPVTSAGGGTVHEAVITGRCFVPEGLAPGNYSGAIVLQTRDGFYRVDMAVVVLAIDIRPRRIVLQEACPTRHGGPACRALCAVRA